MLNCIFLQGHTAHSREYSSDAKFPCLLWARLRTATLRFPGHPRGTCPSGHQSSSAGWEWRKGEPACRTEWRNRPGWITALLRQYKPSGKCNFKLSLHKTKWPEKFNKLFWFSRQKWGWRKDNQKKCFFLWKQVLFRSCKNFLMHFILHSCLSTVCGFVLQKIHCLLNTLL